MNASHLKGQTIAFAASGGLDSCTITRWLTELGVKVVAFTADMAQPDETDLDGVRQRMVASGAIGLLSAFTGISSNTMLQTYSKPRLRGRVVSLHGLTMMGVVPLGVMLEGALGSLIGVPLVVMIGGALTALVALGTVLLVPRVRRLE